MKKLLLVLALILMVVCGANAQDGTYTTNDYFYLPLFGAYGTTEFDEYNDYMQVADTQIEANKTGIAAIDLSLYYLKTAINTQGKMETIWSVSLANTGDLHAAVTIGTANGLSLSTQAISMALSSTSTTGALSSTNWNTFNSKQAGDTALTNISALVYVSPSFISLTADDTYGVRTLAETLTDIGGAALQGVSAIGAVTFNDGTHVLSVATITYWVNGATYTTANPTTCDIDSFETLTANTLYYFYFNDATGTLKCSDTDWNFTTQVMVATVFWNGTNGAIQKEWHNHTRNIAWHKWSHDTIGTRYEAGLSLTAPTTAADATLTIESGSVRDEDLLITIGQQSTSRIVYKASASIYTWVDSSLPYAGSSADPKWLDTDNYTLTSVGNSDFVCMWVYATNDADRHIYIIPTHAADAHNIIAQARAETAPVLSDLNLNPEMKLIYRFIYKGDGQFQESNDYRLTSPLPSGGSASTNASAVSFSPSGNIAATTVQTAIEEVDAEKASLTGNEVLTNKDYNFVDALGADHSYSGQIDSQPVGESVVYGQFCYFNWTDKEYKLAKADTFATAKATRIALESKGDGETCLMLVKGYIRDDSAFDFGAARIFLNDDTFGAADDTAPAESGDQIFVVGEAKSADILYFDPSKDVGEI